MKLVEVRKRLEALSLGSMWFTIRHKWGFALYHYGDNNIDGQELITLLQEFLGFSLCVRVEAGDTEEDAPKLVISLFDPIKARTPKKPERRGSKPDRRQSKRRTSDKAKARLRR